MTHDLVQVEKPEVLLSSRDWFKGNNYTKNPHFFHGKNRWWNPSIFSPEAIHWFPGFLAHHRWPPFSYPFRDGQVSTMGCTPPPFSGYFEDKKRMKKGFGGTLLFKTSHLCNGIHLVFLTTRDICPIWLITAINLNPSVIRSVSTAIVVASKLSWKITISICKSTLDGPVSTAFAAGLAECTIQ